MNGWKVLAPILSVSIALAAGHACSTGTDRDPAALTPTPTGEVEQAADGCGAYRYRGSANIQCDYVGYFVSSTARPPTGRCLNDSQVECTYPMRCQFAIDGITTACVDSQVNSATCWSQYPPEASDPVPQQTYVFDLISGNLFCEGNPTAAQLANYCMSNERTPINNAYSYCRTQTSRNSGSTTCCQPCDTPTPLPDGGMGVMEGTCSSEDDSPDGGVGSDGGNDPDAAVDAGPGSDAGSGSGSGSGSSAG